MQSIIDVRLECGFVLETRSTREPSVLASARINMVMACHGIISRHLRRLMVEDVKLSRLSALRL